MCCSGSLKLSKVLVLLQDLILSFAREIGGALLRQMSRQQSQHSRHSRRLGQSHLLHHRRSRFARGRIDCFASWFVVVVIDLHLFRQLMEKKAAGLGGTRKHQS